MTTYQAGKRKNIEREQGSEADIQFVVPDVFSMNGRTAVFVAFDQAGTAVLNIESDVTGQMITVPLPGLATAELAGDYSWELWAITGEQRWKIGHGALTINKSKANWQY